MSDLDLAALRAAAEAATDGPWVPDIKAPHDIRARGRHLTASTGGMVNASRNAAHIAAFDPPTALALLDRLEAAEARVARVKVIAADAERAYHARSGPWNPGALARDLDAALEDQ